MKNLVDDIVCVEILEDKVRKLEEEVRRYRGSVAGMWDKIRGFIKDRTGTTGDKIQDFVIARYGILHPDYVEILQKIEKGLGRKEGQFVLLVESKIEESPMKLYAHPHRSNMIPPKIYQKIKVNFSLGVLSGHVLIINISSETCYLPTKSFLQHDPWVGTFSPLEDNLPIVAGHAGRDLVQFKKEFYFESKKYREVEMFIGDEEVKRWFADRDERDKKAFKNASTLLNRPLE